MFGFLADQQTALKFWVLIVNNTSIIERHLAQTSVTGCGSKKPI